MLSKKQQEKLVAAWNENHPIGTSVTVRMDDGEIRPTKTRGDAEMLSGHTAVIWLEGISGAYDLTRVCAEAEPAKT